MTDLGEIETRLNADGAQKPWEAFSNGIQTDYGVQNANGSPFIEGWLYVDDAEFIAHAPSDIAFLLARVRELEGQLVRARDAWNRYDRLGARVRDAQDLDAALDLTFERALKGDEA